MRASPPSKWQLRLVNTMFVLLLLVAIGLLQWLSRDHPLRFDWTQNARNSISEASIAAIERLDKPIKITAFASQRANLRAAIRELISRYQKHKSDIELEFVNPDLDPERARAAGIRFEGELMVEYEGVTETLAQLSEEDITNTFVRLGHRGERWFVFLGGHGERSPDGRANFDLADWATELRKRGFQTRVLVLAEHPQIPQNTAAIVIAGPRAALLPGEVKAIESYIVAGGNLLWLADPGPLHGLEPIAEMLGIEFQPGVIVDPGSEVVTGNATAVVATRYSAHPAVKNFRNVTLFPSAVGIRLQAPAGWRGAALFNTRDSAWAETGSLSGPVQLDKGKDTAGPLSLAVALAREHSDTEQRVVVLGDGDFLSNRFLGNGVNLELGLSVANWISRDDAYVSIPVRTNPDRNLELTQTTRLFIAGGFLFLLPVLLIVAGTLIWSRRRKL
ncbi:MAG: GldG family protein [Acidiferrobacterales bacterium]